MGVAPVVGTAGRVQGIAEADDAGWVRCEAVLGRDLRGDTTAHRLAAREERARLQAGRRGLPDGVAPRVDERGFERWPAVGSSASGRHVGEVERVDRHLPRDESPGDALHPGVTLAGPGAMREDEERGIERRGGVERHAGDCSRTAASGCLQISTNVDL